MLPCTCAETHKAPHVHATQASFCTFPFSGVALAPRAHHTPTRRRGRCRSQTSSGALPVQWRGACATHPSVPPKNATLCRRAPGVGCSAEHLHLCDDPLHRPQLPHFPREATSPRFHTSFIPPPLQKQSGAGFPAPFVMACLQHLGHAPLQRQPGHPQRQQRQHRRLRDANRSPICEPSRSVLGFNEGYIIICFTIRRWR